MVGKGSLVASSDFFISRLKYLCFTVHNNDRVHCVGTLSIVPFKEYTTIQPLLHSLQLNLYIELFENSYLHSSDKCLLN